MSTLDRAKLWLSEAYDEETRQAVQKMIDENGSELEESFYKDLEFGTGGMRGIMGVGTNRLNKYTLGAATQGLANYLKLQFPNKELKVAVAHDVRNNSRKFMQIVADVLSANGIKTYIFDNFRPTPELSFAVRYLGCDAGIVLTASHNPPEYNGYKVYWNDGAQVVPPHDNGIIAEVGKVKVEDIKFEAQKDLIETLPNEIDDAFIAKAVEYGARKDKPGYDDLKIVFTSIHGTSIAITPDALKAAGFTNVHVVEEQATPNGNFPTVKSPNPEEPEALKIALDLAETTNADIVIGTDPDADRIGVAVRDFDGKMVLLNGNQTNVVFTDYLLNELKEQDQINGKQFIGSTIVTSDVFFDLADKYGVECKAGLTGFKWIGKMIREAEGVQKFICGGEESFGFMVNDFVRDKDSVTSTLLACHIAAKAKANGSSFYQELAKAYAGTKCYQESLISIVKPGISGAEEIKQMMADWRSNPPKSFNNSPVVTMNDYQESYSLDIKTGEETPIDLPKSNVLIFYTEDGSKVAARPSGTEPKIKFYFSVKAPLKSASEYEKVKTELLERIENIKKELN
ncbi:phospho-sugar mutase [Ornithobacterium rhinotracheale]|uniref:phospho-sugar mutase n=1 Tax=Ornithobacterium rhinotracheale TaxID=28251 RepID=UPI003FA40CA5